MTIRLSTGARTKFLNAGVKPTLDDGFIYLYAGTQPTSPDTGATAQLLGKVTVEADGTTGVTLDTAVAGVLSKAVAELWQFSGLADGQVGWFRFSEAADTPTATSTANARIDGSIGTAGGNLNISNTNIVTDAINTVDGFTIVMPGAAQ